VNLPVVLLIAVSVLAVIGIGLVAVGRVTAELSAMPPTSLFDLGEATEWVGDHLASGTQGRLSYDDVGLVVGFVLDYLEAKGVAGTGEADELPEGPVVVDDADALAWVLGRLDEVRGDEQPTGDAGGSDLDDSALPGPLDDADVAEVVATTGRYLTEIGAVGGVVPETDSDPTRPGNDSVT